MHDESDIRAAWKQGDFAAAAGGVVGQLGPEVLGYLVGTLRDADAADDAFSAFCEGVWSSIARFEWKCSVRTWTYTIARRCAADVVRRESRERGRRQMVTPSQLAAIADHVRTMTRSSLRTETKDALARLRDELPTDDKELLVLRIDRGLSWEELARVFLEGEAPEREVLAREAARLRKRFQLVKERLRERARAAGLLREP
jgi:RNA polymerase sigma-70 factor (ECF subfamily)